MNYKILVDGQEHVIKKQIPAHNREADNKAREEIIRHFLDKEDASEVLIIEAYEDVAAKLLSPRFVNLPDKGGRDS